MISENVIISQKVSQVLKYGKDKINELVVQVVQKKRNNLSLLGFSFEKGGAHTSRTIMLDELKLLLSYIGNSDPAKDAYIKAIKEDNCLGKRSGRTICPGSDLSW